MEVINSKTRTTYQANVRAIAEALGIPLTPSQWVTLENGDDDGRALPMSGRVHVVVWVNHDA